MPVLRSLAAAAALAAIGSAQCTLTTVFRPASSGANGGVIYFDLTVNPAGGVAIVALDTVLNNLLGAIGTLDVYTTPTSFVGNETNPGAWTLVGSAPITSIGFPNMSRATYATPITLPQGTMGVALHANGAVGHAFTVGTGSNQTHSNPDLTLQAGASQNFLFFGGIFTPRVWNGVIHYDAPACATVAPYGTGCGRTPPATFYELFDATNPNDLPGTGITLSWTGRSYRVIQGASPIVTPAGAPTPFTDDDTQQIALPWPYPTQAGPTNSIWVCSNGFVALEPTTETDPTESVVELLGLQMRFCPYWDDLDPGLTGGGSIHIEQDPGNTALFHVTWTGVPEFATTNSNSFQLTLHQSGNAEFKWGAMAAIDGLVGYSPGGGAPDPGGTNVSTITFLPLGKDRLDLSLSSVARPVLGTTAMTQTAEIPPGSPAGLVIYGFVRLDPGISLASLGAPGCFQQLGPDLVQIFVPNGPTQTHDLAIPNNMAFAGIDLNVQSAAFDMPANALGLITSNGIAWRVNLR